MSTAVAAIPEDATAEQTAAANALLLVTVDVSDTTPGIRLSDTLAVEVEEGASGMYTLVLQSAPAMDVTINIARSDADDVTNADVTVSAESLTFTSGNWSRPQTVSVSVANDADTAPEADITLRHMIETDDPAYMELEVGDVMVFFVDNDQAGVTFTPKAVSVTEGQMGWRCTRSC